MTNSIKQAVENINTINKWKLNEHWYSYVKNITENPQNIEGNEHLKKQNKVK